MALVGEAPGIGGVQAIVGAGMGTGVGLMQARAVRRLLPSSASWFWSCVGGLGVPFLAVDAVTALGGTTAYSLPAAVALGGLLAGAWQAVLLHGRYCRVVWWVPASTLGWSLAGGMAASADLLVRWQQIRGIWGAAVYLGLVAVGGLILGGVTGAALGQIAGLSSSRTAEPTAP